LCLRHIAQAVTGVIVRAVQVGWINLPRLTFVAGEQRIGLDA
jgi:hypothetical protein